MTPMQYKITVIQETENGEVEDVVFVDFRSTKLKIRAELISLVSLNKLSPEEE